MFKHLTGSDPVEIEAPIDRVWDVLAATERYGEWNPFTTRVVTDCNVGSPVNLQVALGPLKLKQIERIESVDPPPTLVLGQGIGPSIPTSRTVNSTAGGTERRSGRVRNHGTPNGLLTPLVVLLFERFNRRGFDAMANALKAPAENVVGG